MNRWDAHDPRRCPWCRANRRADIAGAVLGAIAALAVAWVGLAFLFSLLPH